MLSALGRGVQNKIDDTPWSQAARAATEACRSKGVTGGFMVGHQVPNKIGLVCQKD